MKPYVCPSIILLMSALLTFSPCSSTHADSAVAGSTETIVLIRHAEKPPLGLGQLSIKGLNRALALPKILIGKYGKAKYVFAPNPSTLIDGTGSANSPGFSYVRPLATIEPTAIMLELPVNTQIGYTDIAQLQSELTKSKYAHAVVFVSWSYGYLDTFAKHIVKTYGGDPSVVPTWAATDFDSIFVIRLHRIGKKATINFSVDHEGLNGKLSDNYSSVPKG